MKIRQDVHLFLALFLPCRGLAGRYPSGRCRGRGVGGPDDERGGGKEDRRPGGRGT